MREIVKSNPVSCRRDHTMTAKQHSANSIDLKALVAKDRDLVKALMKEASVKFLVGTDHG
jgi:hypothetical protein